MEKYRLKLYRGKWAAVWHDNGTKRFSSGLADRAEAERWFAEYLHRAGKGPLPAVRPVSVILEAYQADRHTQPRPALVAEFGAMEPHHITKEKCRQYAAKRQKQGRSKGTAHTELAHLRSALLWAEREGWIDRAPYIELPQKPPPRDRWLDKSEVEALLNAAETHHVRLFILLALHTAARSEAILQLTWDRVNHQIDFNPPGREKTRKGRARVPINAVLRPALDEARKLRTTDYVIEWGGGGVKSIKKSFARAAKNAGLPGVTPHVLRHTAATEMARQGVPMREIALYLGHSDSRTTERVYAHHHPDYLKGAAAALEHFAPPVQKPVHPATEAEHHAGNDKFGGDKS